MLKLIILIIVALFITVIGSSPLIYCNQTQLLNPFLQSCFQNQRPITNCSFGYSLCIGGITIQSQATNECIEACLIQSQNCDIYNCTETCCHKSCYLLSGLQGAGTPEGCDTIDPNLTIKIVIISTIAIMMALTVIVGVKCFGKNKGYHNGDPNTIRILHDHGTLHL